MFYFLSAAVNETQMSAISTALTGAVNTILDTFIGLLPIIALIVGATFAISWVSRKFNSLRKTRG